jgi:hypothetical protein
MIFIALFACTPQDSDDTDAAATTAPPMGEPIDAPAGEWTWVDVAGTTCDDGSQTGMAVNPGTSNNVLVYMNGGGACWDYTTCFVAQTAAQGPFGAAQWAQYDNSLGGSIFDRTDAENPFKDYSFVFVPYCTGDLHGGDQMVTYSDSSHSEDYYHTGHTNILEDMKRVGPTFPAPDKLVISGASAGGGGVLLNYATYRWYWPDAESYLLDDSLPMLVGDDVQPWLRETWIETWDLHTVVDPICPTACTNDFSQMHVALAADYPDDRMALLSSEQDATISGYLLMAQSTFETNLNELDAAVIEPSQQWNRFFVNGNSHTMIGSPGRFHTSDGVELWPWMTQMVTDDAAWDSVGP